MVFSDPIWLVLAVPVGVLLWLWKMPSSLLRALRITGAVLILLGMAGLAVRLPSREGTVVVIADRSDSMPPDSDAAQNEAIRLIRDSIGSGQQMAVVSFGRRAVIEKAPGSGEFTGFVTEVGPDGSNLNDAIEKALALIPSEAPGRILVLSDGKYTSIDPGSAAWKASARGIAIDYRSIQRSSANDIAISQIDAPFTVAPREAFMINAWIKSPVQQEIDYELIRGQERISAGKRTVPAGLSRLTFRDQAGESGTNAYRLRIQGSTEDPVPENNQARLLVGIEGPKPILVLTASANPTFARLLETSGLKVKVASPEAASWSLEDLSQYSAVIVENVPAQQIGDRGMENIAAWVKETGAGLMMSGGKNSYGPGGYYRSKLEPIMPVSMELKREHRKLSMAIVIAMDRSGSMAVPAGGGKTKMDLANVAAVQVLDLMSSMDELGVIAVDSSPHTVVDLASPADPGLIRSKILRTESGGGGIFVYEALSAAAQMLVNSKAGTRHIILFADAADSEEPGAYKKLLEQCQEAGITVSVVGLGTENDVDAGLLKDIATRGGGRIFFTEKAEELPRLFAQDTFVVARSTFVEEQTLIQLTGGMVSIAGRQFEKPPPIGGYNLCYLKPGATLAALTVDEYEAPIVAGWQAGAGRVLCFTPEADGQYSGPLAQWQSNGDMLASLARWTSGESNSLPKELMVTQELRNGKVSVQLQLDPDRENDPFNQLPSVGTLRGIAGSTPTAEKTSLRWISADTLEANIEINGSETVLSTIEVPGSGRLTLSPVVLPYSPEFKPTESEAGAIALERLASSTGGIQRSDLGGVWDELPRRLRYVPLSPWLLSLALMVLLAEVLQRRTGMLSLLRSGTRNIRFRAEMTEVMSRTRATKIKKARKVDEPRPIVPAEDSRVPEAAGVEDSASLIDALNVARARAQRRTAKRDTDVKRPGRPEN